MNLRRIRTVNSLPLHVALPTEWGEQVLATAKSDRPAADHWKKCYRAEDNVVKKCTGGCRASAPSLYTRYASLRASTLTRCYDFCYIYIMVAIIAD